ncbi:MAG: hypothetical protein ACXQTE_05675, partial [Methanosarcinaceae archaeon]
SDLLIFYNMFQPIPMIANILDLDERNYCRVSIPDASIFPKVVPVMVVFHGSTNRRHHLSHRGDPG